MSVLFFLGLLVLALLVLFFVVHHRPRPRLFLAYRCSNLTVKAHQMQIQGTIGTSKVFDVTAEGTQGESMNVPVDFTFDAPVGSAVFDQASMTVTIAFTALGTANLVETATGTSVSTIHTVTVVDAVAKVDLKEHVA